MGVFVQVVGRIKLQQNQPKVKKTECFPELVNSHKNIPNSHLSNCILMLNFMNCCSVVKFLLLALQ
jgi:hypothetical protein